MHGHGQGLLTDRQRADLHRAIVDYVTSQNISSETVLSLREDLDVQTPPSSGRELEKKWTAIVRLQRKIMAMEQEIKTLRDQVFSNPSGGSVLPSEAAPSLHKSTSDLRPYQALEGHRGRITSLTFHPKWSILCSASEDGTIKVWDVESGVLERTIRAHTRSVQCVSFSTNSGLLVSGSADLSVKVWDPTADFANTRTFLGHDHTVSAVLALPGSDGLVASASRDTTVRIWQIDTGLCLRVIRAHSEWVRTLAAPDGGSVVVSAGADRVPIMTDVHTGVSQIFEGGHSHVIECCAVAPPDSESVLSEHWAEQEHGSGFFFATGGRDNLVLVWFSLRVNEPILKLTGHDNWVQGIAFRGHYLVSVGDDCTMKLWDLRNGEMVSSVEASDEFVSSVASKGSVIATGSINEIVRLWRS